MVDQPAVSDQQPAASQAKAKRSPPWGYLVTSVLVLGVFTFLVLRPELPQQWFGATPTKPDGLGDEPASAGDVSGRELAARQVAAELVRMGQVTTASAPLLQAAPKPVTETSRPIPTISAADESKAAALLAEAEVKYTAMDWGAAESLARRVANLQAKQQTKGRALGLAHNAPLLKQLFIDLDDRDELNRNWETHPSAVRLTRDGKEMLAVPLVSMSDPITPVANDPLAWINGQRRNGDVCLMMQGATTFTRTKMDISAFDVAVVNQDALRADRQLALRQRQDRVNADAAMKRDPSSWYESGKFAYRNRLDDQVTALLDKAIELDPFLSRTIRENNAKELFGKMVMQFKFNNKVAASAFLASIEKRYKGTDQAKQARLYYDGNTKDLLVAAKDSDRKAEVEAEERKQARIDLEKKKGNEEAAKEIAAEETTTEEPVDVAVVAGAPAPAILEKARTLVAKALPLARDASNMLPTPARNHKYHEAAKILREARALFNDYATKNPTDEAVQVELMEASKMWFQANKMATL